MLEVFSLPFWVYSSFWIYSHSTFLKWASLIDTSNVLKQNNTTSGALWRCPIIKYWKVWAFKNGRSTINKWKLIKQWRSNLIYSIFSWGYKCLKEECRCFWKITNSKVYIWLKLLWIELSNNVKKKFFGIEWSSTWWTNKIWKNRKRSICWLKVNKLMCKVGLTCSQKVEFINRIYQKTWSIR